MPPSSPSDDTPAWIKGDLPRDLPEPGADPAPAAQGEEKISRATGRPVEDEADWTAALPATAGETDEMDEPAGAPAVDRLEVDIAARLAELDGVLNDADELPGTPGVAEIDEDLEDELDAAEDEHSDEDDLAEVREADIAERLAEMDSALNDADELPGTPDVAEIGENLEEELGADEDDDEEEDEDGEDEEDEEDEEEEDEVDALEAVEDEGEAEQDNEDQADEDEADVDEDEDEDDVDEDDVDEADKDEAEGFEPDEEESEAGDLEAVEVDDVIILELVEAETQAAEPEPADEMGLPEAAFLAELAQADEEADEGLEAAGDVIEQEEAAAILEAEPAPEEVVRDRSRAYSSKSFSEAALSRHS